MGRELIESFLSSVGPMVVINLPHRTDRRKEFGQELDRIGLSYQHAKVRIFNAIRPEDAAGFPTIGTRGCFLSHLGVLRETVKAGAKAVLICEDDLDFSADILHRLPDIVRTLQSVHWDIFYGGYSDPPAGDVLGHGLVRVAPDATIVCAHFYAVRGQAIHDLMTYLEAILSRPPGHADGGPMHVDGGISRFRADHPQYVTLAAVPPLGHQRSSRTDIHTLRWFDRFPVVRDLAGMLRRQRTAMLRK